MFIGTYYHTLEAKGRVSLPKDFRAQAETWVITRGLDGGLFLFTEADFKSELEKLTTRTFTKKTNRDVIRLFANQATTVTPDANGRVQLPEYLTAHANLTRHLVIVGSISRLEIWDRETYHRYLEEVESRAETLAEEFAQDE